MRWRVPVSGALSALGVATFIAPPLTLLNARALPATPVALLALGNHLVVETTSPNELLLSTTTSNSPVATLSLSTPRTELAVTGSSLWTGSPTSSTLTRVPWSARGFSTPSTFSLTSAPSALVGVSPSSLLVAESDRRVHQISTGATPPLSGTSAALPAVPTLALRGATGSAWFSYPHSQMVTRVSSGSSLSTRTVRAGGVVGALAAGPSGSLVVGLATRPDLQILSPDLHAGPLLSLPVAGARGVLQIASSGSSLFVLVSTSSGNQILRTTLSHGALSPFLWAPLYSVSNEQLVTPRPVGLSTTANELWLIDGATKALSQYGAAPSTAPVLLEPPRVLDSSHHAPAVGDTLKLEAGRWYGALSETYAWYRCAATVSVANPARLLDPRRTRGCRAISHATGATYLTTSADAATHLVAVVSAHSASKRVTTTPSTWTPLLTSPPIEVVALPSISDVTSLNYRTGDVVHLAPGTWLNATSFTYQWFQCTNGVCSTPIPGATSQTYVLEGSDAGHQVEAQVTASSPVTKSVTRSTALSPPIV